MRKTLTIFAALWLVAVTATPVIATNGDILMGIGPVSRTMGGTGIAAPQDAISAVFANPAGMCFGPYCPGSETDAAVTLLMPKMDARVNVAGVDIKADSDEKVYTIPAVGFSVPITTVWRFGLAAYGVSGLGVDYRNTSIDQPQFYDLGPIGKLPLVAGEYTELQIYKIAPSVAFQPNRRFSAGLAVHIDYANLDLRSGSSSGYGFGAQVGAICKLTDEIVVGATYISPQQIDHGNVKDFDGDGKADDLKLEAPQQFGFGVAFEPVRDAFILEIDGRWINWADAKGYEDFDWKDQWVVAAGAQYKPTRRLALRFGYNYGNNPVREHADFAGAGPVSVQGKAIPAYYFETFRVIGMPVIVKHHLSFGAGFEVFKKLTINAGYSHAFKESIRENGTNIAGEPVTLESHTSGDSIEFGLAWRF